MPVGTQYFDAAGVITLDLTDKVGRVLGAVETGVVAGSIVDVRFSTGRPFFIMRGYNVPGQAGVAAPSIVISGNTLSWTAADYPPGNGNPPNISGLIIYGVY